MVESAIFFSFFVILFFSIFDFAQGLYELNVVTEAARHGARSLASRTTVERLCPGDIDAGGRWDQGPAACDGFSSDPGANPPASYTPEGSACLYLEAAGLKCSQFSVERSLLGPYRSGPTQLWSNIRNGDRADDTDKLYSVQVTVSRTTGNSCTICRFTGLAQPSATVVLPLNPWARTFNNGVGFRDTCP